MAQETKTFFCPHCGYTGVHPAGGLCPKCGKNTRRSKRFPISIRAAAILLLIAGMAGYLTFICVSNEDIKTELRQVRQPRPNQFFIGIDVSATIDYDTLEKLKSTLIERLRIFVGDDAVSYTVTTFGNPGCGPRSFTRLFEGASPSDMMTFGWSVEEKIRAVEPTEIAPRDTKPLTTPLHCLMEEILPRHKGGRIIIFSDLMNDDSDCLRQYDFPTEVITAFGQDPNGQIIFFYPTPQLTQGNAALNREIMKHQQSFIEKMTALKTAGRVRVFFRSIPDDPLERLDFLESEFQSAIPATMFDLVMERTTRVLHTIVSAVRG